MNPVFSFILFVYLSSLEIKTIVTEKHQWQIIVDFCYIAVVVIGDGGGGGGGAGSGSGSGGGGCILPFLFCCCVVIYFLYFHGCVNLL